MEIFSPNHGRNLYSLKNGVWVAARPPLTFYGVSGHDLVRIRNLAKGSMLRVRTFWYVSKVRTFTGQNLNFYNGKIDLQLLGMDCQRLYCCSFRIVNVFRSMPTASTTKLCLVRNSRISNYGNATMNEEQFRYENAIFSEKYTMF